MTPDPSMTTLVLVSSFPLHLAGPRVSSHVQGSSTESPANYPCARWLAALPPAPPVSDQVEPEHHQGAAALPPLCLSTDGEQLWSRALRSSGSMSALRPFGLKASLSNSEGLLWLLAQAWPPGWREG